MQLDERSVSILDELLKSPGVTSKELEQKYNLTRRQFGYSFKKINEFIASKNLPSIERNSQGNFIINQAVITNLRYDHEVSAAETNIYSEHQRQYMILLMLLGSQEELSLNHFALELDVSRNTILNDFKKVRELASDYSLEIKYSRIDGYFVEGEEFHIRKLLFNVLDTLVQMNGGEERIRSLVGIEGSELAEIASRIESVEQKLNLKFTDEKVLIMPFDLLLVLRRIRQGNTIESFKIGYKEISHTKEFQAAEEILHDTDISEQERLFITLHLLSTNVYWADRLTEESIPHLKQALEDMLRIFENTACITLQERDELLDKLLLHMTPAYYRIKYHLTEVGDVKNFILQDYKELFHLIGQSTVPLKTLIGTRIPENEIAYLTMLIGGWMRRQGESLRQKTKAIVVCPKGVSVSRLMFTELKELFPEFVFLDSLSVREFYEYTLDFDIIFSPVFLETEKKLFLASSYLKREEKNRLRRQVMLEVQGYTAHEINVEEIMEIVRKHADVKNENQLSKDLQRYISNENSKDAGHNGAASYTLDELITADRISLAQSVPSFEAGIRQCAAPLVDSGHIEQRYVEKMVEQNTEDNAYIILGEGVAIPHAAPEDGVNTVSMSLLKVDAGIEFAGAVIHVIVVIAAVDKEQHLKALLQLKDLAQSKNGRKALFDAQTDEEICKVLQKHSVE
ncbi:BglG family transcription antiterminator [Salinicoccus sp. ID82-1]|uniref:BglG family transcription antiterminator n=1 Tax=Salinicoccus sp. ID82-1 TaxID=2820269 RepID=UPI001F43A201|nr:BglG family transcription antiterminator [Salinicoccus sp. ID82-1]MCG1009724.1 BglG family transcription antiterminator [Salinicoccus sp. ID82-1]